MNRPSLLALLLFLVAISKLNAQTQVSPQPEDATALEAQYKTCYAHYIPAERCSAEVYRQLKVADSHALTPEAAAALKAVKAYRVRLKNTDSLQVQTAYVEKARCRGCGDDDLTVCLQVSAQNGFGGYTPARIAVMYAKGKEHWFDEGGVFGSMSEHSNGMVDRWGGVCSDPPSPFHSNPKLWPGVDVTEDVNKELHVSVSPTR
ncbi:hypothetical protein [Terriglobus sp. TAA 43]|uniref:hypothetical protein n=1 Tax=Terriglobus sp. TAA 43 TaxID=278961 RepID=UPI0006486465|nr:hypothetical protein [Terriglobus sp. TAA 43]